jgi:hypothetical protein
VSPTHQRPDYEKFRRWLCDNHKKPKLEVVKSSTWIACHQIVKQTASCAVYASSPNGAGFSTGWHTFSLECIEERNWLELEHESSPIMNGEDFLHGRFQ